MVGSATHEVLALIQARGGSKGLPGKNLRLLAGHPLIAYSIAAARSSHSVSRVIVSTDSEAIGAIAEQYGAEVPFFRPAELAQDDSLDFPLFRHALDWLLEREGYRPDILVQLRPTSPFRSLSLVDEGVSALVAEPTAHSLRTVTPSKENPYKCWRMGPDGFLTPLMKHSDPEPYNASRQSLPECFWQTGHLDVFHNSTVTALGSLTGTRVVSLLVPREYCVDIDHERDWLAAEAAAFRPDFEIVRPDIGTTRSSPDGDEPDKNVLPIDLAVLDFDGVLTDNRVWTTADGVELVACDRSDGMGLEMLRARGIQLLVLSKERNPVVAARCRKLNVECLQGIDEKASVLRRLFRDRGIAPERVAYVGNDMNDLECLQMVGLGAVVADAHPSVLGDANVVLTRPGGRGAVREFCDRLLRGDFESAQGRRTQ